jgi:nucleotide-binding universal stress UspA family protein
MKPIVAPTDFSPVSLNAVNYAADMACTLDTNLVLLHVCRLPVAYTEIPVTPDTITTLMSEGQERLTRLKEDIELRIRDRINITCEVRAGMVVTEIENFAASISPYAVVMGPHGAGTFERFFLGSNTISAMKNLTWPLIVVPPEARFKMIRKIGLACDLKKVVETAPIEELKSLVRSFQAELHVIHVNSQEERAYTPEIIEESGLLQEMLNDLRPVYDFLNNVDIDQGLSDYAEKNRLDLLIVIPKKHGLFDKFFHKSHAKQLILHTHVPVMSVHE